MIIESTSRVTSRIERPIIVAVSAPTDAPAPSRRGAAPPGNDAVRGARTA